MPPEERSRDELTGREHRHQERRLQGVAQRFGVDGEQRKDQREAKDIGQHDQENRQQRRRRATAGDMEGSQRQRSWGTVQAIVQG